METRSRGSKKLTTREQERVIQKIFELRMQLIALVARLLQNGVDEDALEAELLIREQISGQAH